jgi:hypothetical protein
MAENTPNQSVVQRALADTKAVRQNWKEVACVQVGAPLVLGLLSYYGQLEPELNTWFWVVIGAGGAWLLIFLFNLWRAPFRQRDEATREITRLYEEKEAKEQKARTRKELAELLKEGVNIRNGFYPFNRPFPDGPVSDCRPIQYYNSWRSRCRQALLNNGLEEWEALFFTDTTFSKRGSTKETYIKACDVAMERLKEILKYLR